jgi:hypothetical protein
MLDESAIFLNSHIIAPAPPSLIIPYAQAARNLLWPYTSPSTMQSNFLAWDTPSNRGLWVKCAKRNNFCVFHRKRSNYFLGGTAPNSLGPRPSAKRNNAFCFFFRKKKNSVRLIVSLGASPQTPRARFARLWDSLSLPRSGTVLFASLSGKRIVVVEQWSINKYLRFELEFEFLV